MAPSDAEFTAVYVNGAGLPQDKILRQFLWCRHYKPKDSLTDAIKNKGMMSLYFDEKELLKSELDFYVHWNDFTHWIETKTAFEVPASIEVMNILDNIQDYLNFENLGPVEIPEDIIHHYNFLKPLYLSKTPIRLEGVSIVVKGETTQILISGKIESSLNPKGEAVFIYSNGSETDIDSRIVDYLDVNWIKDFAGSVFKFTPYLHSYIQACEIELVNQRTKYSEVKEKLSKDKNKSRLTDRIQYRVIRRVKRVKINTAFPPRVNSVPVRTEPDHRVHVHGFWRKCKGIGKDPNGNPVIGKTWVRNHTRWNQKPEKVKTVWVKEPLEKTQEK